MGCADEMPGPFGYIPNMKMEWPVTMGQRLIRAILSGTEPQVGFDVEQSHAGELGYAGG